MVAKVFSKVFQSIPELAISYMVAMMLMCVLIGTLVENGVGRGNMDITPLRGYGN